MPLFGLNSNILPSYRLLLAAIALGTGGSFHFGYQLSTPNPTVNVFRRFLNHSYTSHYGQALTDSSYRGLWSCVLTLQSLGCVLGSLVLVPVSENLGRKRGFFIVFALTSVGLALQIASLKLDSFETLASGRLVVGVASGLVLGLQPMYLNEVSPNEYRGAVSGTTGVFLEFGFGLGAAVALPDLLGSETTWPYVYLFELLVAALMMIVLPWLPESPRYLAAKGNKVEALQALRFYRHSNPSESMRQIEEDLQSQDKTANISDLFRKPYLRRGVLLGLAVFTTVAFSGILALDYFSTFLLIEVGLSPRVAEYATVAILSQPFLATIVSSFIVDRLGRRPVLLWSIVSLAVCNSLFLLFSLLYKHYGSAWLGYACILVCICFTLTFGIGPSVLQWVISAEMVPQNARSPSQSLTYTLQRIISIVVSFTFFPLQGAVGTYSLLMFIVPLPIMFIIFYIFLPETKNRTTLEIMNSLGYEREYEAKTKRDSPTSRTCL